MTPAAHTWTLAASWSGVDTGRYSIEDLTTNFTLKEFIWGNTTYTWSVNVSNATSWVNESYTFTTNATSGDGANARYDVDGDDDVDLFDALYTWNNREFQATYNGIYDFSLNDRISVQDVLYVWNNRGGV